MPVGELDLAQWQFLSRKHLGLQKSRLHKNCEVTAQLCHIKILR